MKPRRINPHAPPRRRRGTTNWKPIRKIAQNSIPDLGLVYEVRVVDKNRRPLPITDGKLTNRDGIIYIGEQELNTGRARKLVEGFQSSGKKDEHGLATKYYRRRLHKTYPVENLQFRWTLVDAPPTKLSAEARKLVEKLWPAKPLQRKPMANQKRQPPDSKVASRNLERSKIQNFVRKWKRLPILNDIPGVHTRVKPLPKSGGARRLKGGKEIVHLSRNPYQALAAVKRKMAGQDELP